MSATLSPSLVSPPHVNLNLSLNATQFVLKTDRGLQKSARCPESNLGQPLILRLHPVSVNNRSNLITLLLIAVVLFF